MSGYTEQGAEQAHDLIHGAEAEEQKLHGRDAMTTEDPGPAEKTNLGSAPPSQPNKSDQNQSAFDKLKDVFNMKK